MTDIDSRVSTLEARVSSLEVAEILRGATIVAKVVIGLARLLEPTPNSSRGKKPARALTKDDWVQIANQKTMSDASAMSKLDPKTIKKYLKNFNIENPWSAK